MIKSLINKINIANVSMLLTCTCTLLQACSKDKNSLPDPAAAKFPSIEVSKLVTEGDKTYLQVNDRPFPLLGAQIRLDALTNCDKLDISQIEPYFAKAAELNLNCVQLPIWWNKIEPREGQYDYGFVDQMLAFAIKYGLKVELLWFSTNMVGDSFSYLVPQYILSNLNNRLLRSNEAAFWNYYGYQYSLILDDAWLLEKEKKAITNLFNYIRNWDEQNGNTHPVITAQIHNEPDAFLRWRINDFAIKYRNGDLLSKEEAWKMTLHALDEIGKAVKSSTYKVVTRSNVVYSEGIDPFGEFSSARPTDIFQLDGIDVLSVDTYKETIAETKSEVLSYRSLAGNYPLIAENKGAYSNTPSLMLTTIALGGGYDIYDLATSKFFIDNTSPDNQDQIDHGIYTWDLKDKPHTAQTRVLLKGLTAASPDIAKTRSSDFAAFNLSQNFPHQVLQQKISTTNATIAFTTESGAIGFALDRNDYILIYFTSQAAIKIENGEIGQVEIGEFDQAGNFVVESTLQKSDDDGMLSVRPGKLYRIKFKSYGALTSTTEENIGKI